jgi:hypothetical protein
MFGSTKYQPPPEPKLFGVDQNRVATNEAARVLPYFCGAAWLGVTWLGDVWNVRTDPITQKVGKHKNTTGYNYFASFTALVCAGPVDRITQIKMDGEIVWTGQLDRADSDYVDITIENRGIVRLYWGTETQTIDTDWQSSAQEISPLRGQCYLIGRDIFFGANRTNAPNIELTLYRWPKPSWLNPVQSVLMLDSNPIAVLWDWWTNPRFGAGYDESTLDIPRLQRGAERLRTEDIGVSPMLTSEGDFKTNLARLLEYIDGYPTTYDGLFGIELMRPDFNSVVPRLANPPLITKEDLIGDYRLSSQTWPETFDETLVKFSNRDWDGQPDMAKHHDISNFQTTGQHRSQTIERPWITRASIATRMAAVIGRVSGLPQSTGSLKLLQSGASELVLGQNFQLETRDGERLVLTVDTRDEAEPDKSEVGITFKSDTSWANAAYYTPDGEAKPETPTYAPVAAYAIRIFDAPYAFSDPNLASLIFMVARGDEISTNFNVWKAPSPEGPYQSYFNRSSDLFSHFAIKAKLTIAKTDATLPIDNIGISFQVVSPFDKSLLDGEYLQNDALDHTLLGFLGPTASEIVSLFDIQNVSPNNYTAKIVRGLYDTKRRSWPVDTELWIQLATRVEHYAWPPIVEAPRYFKFQPIIGPAEVPLGDLTPIEFTENGRALRPIVPTDVKFNGQSNNAIWNHNTSLTVTWKNTSRARTIFGTSFAEFPATDLTAVRLQFLSPTGGVFAQKDVPPSESTTQFSAVLGGVFSDFIMRVYGVRDGWLSLDYAEMAIDYL